MKKEKNKKEQLKKEKVVKAPKKVSKKTLEKKETEKLVKENKKINKKKITNKKRKKSKKRMYLIMILSILLVTLILTLLYYLDQEKKDKLRLEKLKQEQELVEKITSHYGEFVKTSESAKIYNEKEEEVGFFYGQEVSLEETIIDKNTKYFKIKDFEDTYIKYKDVEIIDNPKTYNTRYKNYIVFNENIITGDKTIFYDEEDNKIYEFNKSFDLPIIIKEKEKYGVEFNERLLYVKKDNVKEIKSSQNTTKNNTSGVAVLNYHAFYDETKDEKRKACNTIICHSKAQFKTHLDYIKNNNILTLRANEIEMYVDGKIQLPKSVYITIDDGVKSEHAVDMLTEYKMDATIFLVTSWAYEPEFYKTEYIELHSHTHNLHNGGACPGGQGGAIKCLDRQTLLADLKQSREDLNGSTVFCYPFYEYNEYSISVLKEAGFTMAFAGEYGDMLVKVGMDKFRLPRFVITTYTTMYDIENYFNKIKN